jgi:hypothetical protein
MLVPAALVPDALLEGEWGDLALTVSAHRQAAKQLLQTARLMTISDEHREDLLETAGVLPQALRTLWLAALTDLLDSRSSPARSDSGSLVEQCLQAAEVIGVTRAYVESLGSESGRHLDAATGHEVVRLECLPLSERFARAEALKRADVAEGEDREAVWTCRIRPIAEISAQAVLVDQYAYASLLKGDTAGLPWLMRRLSALPRRLRRLEIITAEESLEQVAATARQVVNANPPADRVWLTTVPSSRFVSESHSRHVRFVAPSPSTRRWALMLDKGIQPLDESMARRSWPCLLGDEQSAHMREDRLRAGGASLELT